VAYDRALAQRIREHLGPLSGVSEREMFSGITFMIDGNMVCGVIGEELIARLGPEAAADALRRPEARVFDFTGRPMRNWVVVEPGALEDDGALAEWVDDCLDYARSLPPK
jgi:hypothetical protein